MVQAGLRGAPPHSLTAKGYRVLRSALGAGEGDALQAELTVSPPAGPYGRGGARPVVLLQQSATSFYLPKHYGIARYGLPPPEARRAPAAEPANLAFVGRLRGPQQAVVDRCLRVLRAETGAILHLPCGMGKTVIALRLAALLGVKTLVLVHKDFLVQQWRERIAEFLPAARTGLIRGSTFDVAGKDVVLATIQTLALRAAITRADLAPFGLLVADECHHLGAEVFSRALQKARAPYTLGLTATLARKDGLSRVFQWFLGRVAYRAAARRDAVAVDALPFASADPAYSAVPTLCGSGKVNYAAVINNICACAPRNALLADRTVAALREHAARKVLVLSDRLSQLRELEALCAARGVEGAGYYVGGRKPGQLAVAARGRLILGTYAMASEGMDVPALNALVLASPKADVQQSVGRILRQRPADRALLPLVIDVRDAHPVVQGANLKRARFYDKSGFSPLKPTGPAAPAHRDDAPAPAPTGTTPPP